MPIYRKLFARKSMKQVAAALFTLAVVQILSLPSSAEIELFGGNPLLDAIKTSDPQRVEAAIVGGESFEVQDFDGRRPLIYAALVGNLDILDILIKRTAKIDHQDKLGNSALFYAASQGDAEVCETLIEAGGKFNYGNRQGITPLMAAAKLGHLDVVQLLLARDADPKLRDFTGRTALMWADWNQKSTISRLLRKSGVRE